MSSTNGYAVKQAVPIADKTLIGIGLYTPAEASRLVRVDASTISRWLRGHSVSGRFYDPLWTPQVDFGDESLFLGFRDLQEIRVAAAFIAAGLSAQRVRQAIGLARTFIDDERPLSTSRFRTDGRSVFLQVVHDDGQTRLIDLFKKQYAFKDIVERSLSNLDYDAQGVPSLWWPLGRKGSIVVDPARSFGQPIEAETSVPASILVAAAEVEGSHEAAARAWDVPVRAVNRAVAFEREMSLRVAA